VIEHVGRLGGSGFAGESYDVALSPGIGIGFSELHRLRRQALAALSAEILRPWAERPKSKVGVPALSRASDSKAAPIELVAVAGDLDGARACIEAGADVVHVPVAEWPAADDPRIVPLLPRISFDSGRTEASMPYVSAPRIVASTLGQLCEAGGGEAHVEAHWSLNVTNPFAVAELVDMGASQVWLSPELNGTQISETAAFAEVPVGIAVLGRQELMVTEHCVLMAEGECDCGCARCARRRAPRWLKDRKGYRFPVRTDEFGRSHVYNAVPLDLLGSLREVLSTGVRAVRLDLETLSAAEAATGVARARRALAGETLPERHDSSRSSRTTGHFFRGVA
jgi:putative protease